MELDQLEQESEAEEEAAGGASAGGASAGGASAGGASPLALGFLGHGPLATLEEDDEELEEESQRL